MLALFFLSKIKFLLAQQEVVPLSAILVFILYGPVKLLSQLLKDYAGFLSCRFIAESFFLATSRFFQKIVSCRPHFLQHYSASQLFAPIEQAQGTFGIILYNLFFIFLPALAAAIMSASYLFLYLGPKYLIIIFVFILIQEIWRSYFKEKIAVTKKNFAKEHMTTCNVGEDFFAMRSQIALGGPYAFEDASLHFLTALENRRIAEIAFFQQSGLLKGAFTGFEIFALSCIYGLIFFDYYKLSSIGSSLFLGTFLVDKLFARISEMLYSLRMLINQDAKLEAWSKVEALADEAAFFDCHACFLTEKIVDETRADFFEVADLFIEFDDKVILQNFSYNFAPKGLFVVVGPNGSGKTSLLNILAGFSFPKKGDLFFEQQNTRTMNASSVAKNFAYVEQNPLLFSQPVLKNLFFGLNEQSLALLSQEQKDFLGLDFERSLNSWAGPNNKRLSKGLVEKVRIINAVLRDPKVLILDEPSGNFDNQSKQVFISLLLKQAAQRCVIVASHDSEIIDLANFIIRLDKFKM